MASRRKVSIISDIIKEKQSKADDIYDGNSPDMEKANKIKILGYDPDNKGPRFGARHVQIILIYLGMTIGFSMRNSLSVAIVAMTDNTTSSNPNVPTYDWDNTSVILSSFFWGYICLQVFAGYVGKTYGPKYFLSTAFLINSIAFMLIPLAAAKLGSKGVMMCRIVQGLTQGFLFPSGHTILGKWAPAEERSTMGIIVYSGVSCGSILSLIVTGLLSASWVGWPSSFYVFGGLGVAWYITYLVFGYNSPATHPTITKEERNYIEVSLGQSNSKEKIGKLCSNAELTIGSGTISYLSVPNLNSGKRHLRYFAVSLLLLHVFVPTPWKSILTCVPLYAIVVGNIGNAWGYAMTMTEIPTYLSKVMGFDMKSNGFVSAIPYAVGLVSGLIIAPTADYLIKKGYISRVNVRRSAQLIGAHGQMVCLLLLAYVSNSKPSAIILLAVANIFNAATLIGYSVNHVDLSPRFSGIMQGISNATSQTIAIFSPLLVQLVVKDLHDASQWRIIFIVAAAMYVACSIFYAIFTSATRQKWDGPQNETLEKIEKIKRASVISIPDF